MLIHTPSSIQVCGLFAALALTTGACKPATPASPPTPATPEGADATSGESASLTPSHAAGLSGQLRVLSDDSSLLLRPTTSAIRGDHAWVAIGQLGSLFGDGNPQLPFAAVSLPLSGGGSVAQRVELPGSSFYPEGITDAADGTLYIGSIMGATVLRVPADSTQAEPFVGREVIQRGVIGLEVDEARQLLWLCDSNPKLPEAELAGEVVGVRLSDGQEVVRHVLPLAGDRAPFCNDALVDPHGDLWVTDSRGGRLFRLAADQVLTPTTLTAFVDGGLVGPPPTGGSGANGLEWVDDNLLIVANVGRGTLVAVDPGSTDPQGSARNIPLTRSGGTEAISLCSPDGLSRLPGQNAVVVVENGGCDAKAPRIAVIELSSL